MADKTPAGTALTNVESGPPTEGTALVTVDPAALFEQQAPSLKERINEIELSDEERAKIEASSGSKIAMQELLGLTPITRLFKIFWDWNAKINETVNNVKRDQLIANYLNRQDNLEKGLETLVKFVTDSYGNVLFNKVAVIQRDSPPDDELARHLGAALTYMANSDFQRLFVDHKYALAQIETLTPQAIMVLTDYMMWPEFQLGQITINGGRITSDWTGYFTNSYAAAKGVGDSAVVARLQHTVADLWKRGFVEAFGTFEPPTGWCKQTHIGELVTRYLA